MTDLSKIDDLIERLKKLDGPCRNLDAEICLLFADDFWRIPLNGPDGELITGNKPDGYSAMVSKSYTSSIDAAITLVPDGSEWHITNIYGRNQAAVDLNSGHGSYSSGAKNWPATPAIAICIAALKARASQTNTDTGE